MKKHYGSMDFDALVTSQETAMHEILNPMGTMKQNTQMWGICSGRRGDIYSLYWWEKTHVLHCCGFLRVQIGHTHTASAYCTSST